MTDLTRRFAFKGAAVGALAAALPATPAAAQSRDQIAPFGREYEAMEWRRGIENQRRGDLGDGKIGRASCRERVSVVV